MINKIFLAILLVNLTACNSKVGEILVGPQPKVSPTLSSSCHQQARDYVKKNWQNIGRDWIKHEEYRQYKLCVDKQKTNNS